MSEETNANKAEEPLHTGHRERLREKYQKAGLTAFHDYEAVELLLTYAIPRRDVKPVAKALLRRFGSLRALFDATPDDLKRIPGIGDRVSVLIKLVKELGTAYLKERAIGKSVISSPDDVIDYLNHELSGSRIEKFMAIYLSTKNEVLSMEILHEGTLDQTAIYPRKVIESALKHNARSIIFVHNHPSGDSTPSRADIRMTKELERAAKAVDMKVHDHIIIGRGMHYSLRDGGWPT